MLVVSGSVTLDTITTPKKTAREVLGGAATFAAVSASYFVNTCMIGVVGEDFPRRFHNLLARRVDLGGLVTGKGKTFRYHGAYDRTLNTRRTIKTELNVLEDFRPHVPDAYRKAKFVYLANSDPEQNTRLIGQFENVRFSMCDTIDFWIKTKRRAVIKMIGSTDAVVINDEEARTLTKEANLLRCAKKMAGWGARLVVIKKAEHGSIVFADNMVFPTPGFPVEGIRDPTGAGDAFAGAMIGYLASKNSTSTRSIRRAIQYANVMGAFAVEGYGLGRLNRLARADIQRRLREYQRMIGPAP